MLACCGPSFLWRMFAHQDFSDDPRKDFKLAMPYPCSCRQAAFKQILPPLQGSYDANIFSQLSAEHSLFWERIGIWPEALQEVWAEIAKVREELKRVQEDRVRLREEDLRSWQRWMLNIMGFAAIGWKHFMFELSCSFVEIARFWSTRRASWQVGSGWIQVFRRLQHRWDLDSTGLPCRRCEQQAYKHDEHDEHAMFVVQLAILSYFQAGGDSFIVEVDDAEFEMVLSLWWLIPL